MDLKFNRVALGGRFLSGLFRLGQELYFDVFDIRFHRRFRKPALCFRGQYEKF
jgi:hypothetical protein